MSLTVISLIVAGVSLVLVCIVLIWCVVAFDKLKGRTGRVTEAILQETRQKTNAINERLDQCETEAERNKTANQTTAEEVAAVSERLKAVEKAVENPASRLEEMEERLGALETRTEKFINLSQQVVKEIVPRILNAVGMFLSKIEPETLLQDIQRSIEAIFGKLTDEAKSAAEDAEPEEPESTAGDEGEEISTGDDGVEEASGFHEPDNDQGTDDASEQSDGDEAAKPTDSETAGGSSDQEETNQ